MGPEWVSIIALVALFVIGTLLPINMGALAYVAAWLVGMNSLNLDEKDILAGVSGDLVLTLIGVTYLFAIARNNGTVDLIVRSAVKAVGGRVALIPWVMFAVTALLTAIGAASPAACAIIGPIALGFAGRYKISPLMMGMMVVHGAQGGGFSPISIYGIIDELRDGGQRPTLQRDRGLPRQPGRERDPGGGPVRAVRRTRADVAPGRRRRAGHSRRGPAPRRGQRAGPGHRGYDDARRDPGRRRSPRPDPHAGRVRRRGPHRAGLRQEIGFVSITAAVILAMLAPQQHKNAVRQIAWPTVLLVAGVSTYATILTTAGSPEFVGNWAAGLGAAAIGALILCYVGGVVSAFASSTALLPVIIPIAVPLIANGGISAAMFVAALAVSSTIVDVSPFSTNGALMLANRPLHHHRAGRRQADPDLQRDRGPGGSAAGLGRSRSAGLVTTMTSSSSLNQGPLAGALVVDLTRALAGPHARMMLGDLGARVIRSRPRDAGTTPAPGDHRSSASGRRASRRTSLPPTATRKSIALDLKDEAGDVLPRLLERADVLLENFRTGSASGSGSHRRASRGKPRLVVLSITGFGDHGPEGGRAGYDEIAQGEAGFMSRRVRGRTTRRGSASRSPTCWPGCTGRTAWRRRRPAEPTRVGT